MSDHEGRFKEHDMVTLKEDGHDDVDAIYKLKHFQKTNVYRLAIKYEETTWCRQRCIKQMKNITKLH